MIATASPTTSPGHRFVALTFPSHVALLLTTLVGPTPHSAVTAFHFAHDGILGTSLELTFTATTADEAAHAERAALAEIERLRTVLSSYDAQSELSRLVATGRAAHPSADLSAVLSRYTFWNQRSGGAYSARVAPLTALWRAAEADRRLPAEAELAAATARLAKPAWTIDASGIHLLTTDRLDLNSLGKGYIIDRALDAARAAVPSLGGGMINLGGDVRAWGVASADRATWRVGVADPRAPADNAAPLVILALTDRAVSSSGRYARGFNIRGTHYSHIIDPRSGRPANAVAATTVIAPDNATANALATTLSVLTPDEGLHLAATTPGVEAMIVGADGVTHRTAGFAAYEIASPAPAGRGTVTATVTINITPSRPNRHRPYVAVWVTDADGKPVRTLAFWGTKRKYIPDMSKWYGVMSTGAPAVIDAVTRATRPVGEYTLEWDGLDDAGNAVKAGPYTFWFEAAFENGPHSLRSTMLDCTNGAVTGAFETTPAFVGGTVTCRAAK
jgi:thiamine biosynthesis lipoprotein ApbE